MIFRNGFSLNWKLLLWKTKEIIIKLTFTNMHLLILLSTEYSFIFFINIIRIIWSVVFDKTDKFLRISSAHDPKQIRVVFSILSTGSTIIWKILKLYFQVMLDVTSLHCQDERTRRCSVSIVCEEKTTGT